jgi:hypothetical protein
VRIVRMAALALAAALLLMGCSKPPEVMLQRLDPEAPAASGLPSAPLGNQPSPLLDRPPFGLYAEYPSSDTLTLLSSGTLSPDGRFRAALTTQGLWVARKDGAWLWQVPVPGADKPAAPVGPPLVQPATPPAPPPAAAATSYIGPLQWTSHNTLLLRDNTGTWVETTPETARVNVLPQALQGKEALQFSPDGKQVLFSILKATGRELWVSNADGSKPQYLGVNVIGTWDPTGKVSVAKAEVLKPGALQPREQAPGLSIGPVRE